MSIFKRRPRRIFIIGPANSGKTVLLSMLSRYVETCRNDLVLEPMDAGSNKYVTDAQKCLALGDWPPPTPMGEIKRLRWCFGHGKHLHEMEMVDSAGQDLYKILHRHPIGRS